MLGMLAAVALTVLFVVVLAIARSSPDTPAMPFTSVEAAISAGRKIEAIKLYRARHGVGLREAKLAVEELSRTRPMP